MQIIELKKERLFREYEAVIEKKVIEEKVLEQIKEYSSNAKLPGYRKGNIPLETLVKKYSDSLKKEIINEFASDIMEKITKDYDIKYLASEPKLSINDSDPNLLKYSISFEIQPNIDNINFDTVTVKVDKVKITDEDIKKYLSEIFEIENIKLIPVKRAIKLGDQVTIKYSTKIKNKLLDKDIKRTIEIGKNEEIDKHILNKTVGETISFEHEYKEGKKIDYVVEILEVNEKSHFDEMGDEFAVSKGYKNLEDLKNSLKADLEEDAVAIFENNKIQAIRNILLECLPNLEAPTTFVNLEYLLLKSTYLRDNIFIPGISESSTEEEKDVALMALAEKNVKVGLIIKKLGQDFNVKVTEKEVLKALKEKNLPANKENINYLTSQIFETKIFAKLENLIKLDENIISLGKFEELENIKISNLKNPKSKDTNHKNKN